MLTKTIVTVHSYLTNLQREEGQGLAEYALIIVLVAIAVVTALGLVGDEISNTFDNIVTSLQDTGE